jgi:hypothetical protein
MINHRIYYKNINKQWPQDCPLFTFDNKREVDECTTILRTQDSLLDKCETDLHDREIDNTKLLIYGEAFHVE